MRHVLSLSVALAAILGCSDGSSPNHPPPSAGIIVFSEEVVPGLYGLFTIRTDGTARQPIATPPDISLILPVISPDGQTIAATGYRFPFTVPELFLVAVDGSTFDSVPAATGFQGVSWSPDGQHLAIGCFNSTPPVGEAPAAICTMNRNGSGLQQLTHSVTNHWWPTWSPDGTEIAFTADSQFSPTDTVRSRIFSLTVATGAVRQVSPDTFSVDRPERSDDGTYLSYYATPNAGPQRAYLIRDDGTGHREISPGATGIPCAALSPGRDRVVLCLGGQLVLARMDGTILQPFTSDTVQPLWPAWIPQ